MRRSLLSTALVSTALAAATAVLAQPAMAFEVEECWGWDVHWDHDPVARLLPVSWPAGNVFRDDLMMSFARWNDMRGMSFEWEEIVDDNNNTFAQRNDRNEFLWHSTATDGALAVTIVQYDACFFGQEIEEIDMIFDNTLTWETGAHNPRVEETTFSFRFTAVHELGHALGLKHEDDVMSVMLSTASGFHGGNGNLRAAPFPDDARGARRLYDHSNSETDFSISNFRWESSDNTGLVLGSGTQSVAPGDTFTTGFALGNQGKTRVEFPLTFVLSTNDNITTSDRSVASGTGFADPGFYGDFTFNFTVPDDLAPGTYVAGAILDHTNDVVEARAGNNRVAFPGTISVSP